MSGQGIVTAGVPRGGEIKHKDRENEEVGRAVACRVKDVVGGPTSKRHGV